MTQRKGGVRRRMVLWASHSHTPALQAFVACNRIASQRGNGLGKAPALAHCPLIHWHGPVQSNLSPPISCSSINAVVWLSFDFGSSGNMQARGWNHVVPLPSRFFQSVCLVIDLIRDFRVGTFRRWGFSGGSAGSFLAASEVPIIMIDPSALRRVTNVPAAGRFAMHGAVGHALDCGFGGHDSIAPVNRVAATEQRCRLIGLCNRPAIACRVWSCCVQSFYQPST